MNKREINSGINEKTSSLSLMDNLQIVSFNLGKEEFAINIKYIQEIIKVQQITPVPLTKPYVEGVMNIRGNIIPVVNLRVRMNLESLEITNETRIIVIGHDSRKVGFIVDNMNEVVKVPYDQVKTAPDSAEDQNSMFVESISVLEDRLITILDIEKLLEEEE